MSVWWLFALIFAGGPAIYHLGLWLGRGRRAEATVLIGTLGLVLVAVLLQYTAQGQNAPLLAAGATTFWLAWIGILIFCALRVRRVFPGSGVDRWSRVVGAVGTTIPWFGFVTATMIAG